MRNEIEQAKILKSKQQFGREDRQGKNNQNTIECESTRKEQHELREERIGKSIIYHVECFESGELMCCVCRWRFDTANTLDACSIMSICESHDVIMAGFDLLFLLLQNYQNMCSNRHG